MVDKKLSSGSTDLLVLRLLLDRDMYGYEMIEALRERSNDAFDLKTGTLYPLLHSLELRGELASYEREAGGKTRKYYHLTPGGKAALERRLGDWQNYVSAVGNVLNFESGV